MSFLSARMLFQVLGTQNSLQFCGLERETQNKLVGEGTGMAKGKGMNIHLGARIVPESVRHFMFAISFNFLNISRREVLFILYS